MEQLLKKDIEARNLPLGATPTGQDWCIKALHPSDPLTEVQGLPDPSAVPSVLMNYQMTYTVRCNVGALPGSTWAFNAAILPHPLNFMQIETATQVGGGITLDEFEVLNTQVVGVTHEKKYQNFKVQAERWRLAYMGVTVYQDGADLTNQGTIVACQPPVQPLKTHAQCYYSGAPPGGVYVTSPTEWYVLEDKPDFNVSQGMPNAYFSRSRDGCYMPLKLTETAQDWLSEAHEVTCGADNVMPPWNDATGNYGPLPAAPYAGWPHIGLRGAWVNQAGAGGISGDPTSPMGNAAWGHICARNLAVSTSFSFFFRCGWELQVRPGSTLAPHMKISPPYDPTALTTYYAISRELKDAYPAAYNDLGEMWDAISKAARQVLPFIRMVGPVGNALGMAGQGIITGGDIIRSRRKAKKQTNASAQLAAADARSMAPSGTEVERARQVISARRATPRARKQRRQPPRKS